MSAQRWTPHVPAGRENDHVAPDDCSRGSPHHPRLEIGIHIDLGTTELAATTPLAAGGSRSLALVPGRTYAIPVAVAAGETVSITTSSKEGHTILVLLAPDGTLVLGSDGYKGYLAGFEWVAPVAGTYQLRVTSFEGVSTRGAAGGAQVRGEGARMIACS